MPTEYSGVSTLPCSKCGTSLPEDAQFCLKCGTGVLTDDVAPKAAVGKEPLREPSRPQRKRSLFRWILPAFVLAAIVWAAASENPSAQAFQEFVGWKHDEAILDNTFSVQPHDFRSYKFTLLEASTNVLIVGEFTASVPGKGSRQGVADSDRGIEVYVLSESAFAVWQRGYATGSIYESGRVASGNMQADLPAGAGVYYLVFSNKFSTDTGKAVEATALLRYKSWLPAWFRTLRNDVWNWIGL